MKILHWDIETSPIIATAWQLYDVNINTDDIIEDWKIICAAWSWEGEDTIKAKTWKRTTDRKISPVMGFDDRDVIEVLHREISKADALCAQNGDNFDLKKFNARCIQLGFDPVPPIQTIDTLKVARRHFKFTSNKLDFIGQYLNVGEKAPTSKGLWNRVIRGDKKALAEMVEYNKQDVSLLKKVYHKLKPWMQNHPNHNLWQAEECCPNCGSNNLKSEGYRTTRTARYRRLSCNDCGAWSKGSPVKHPVRVR